MGGQSCGVTDADNEQGQWLSLTEADVQLRRAFDGKYEILGELGAGTFGRVYRARRVATGQLVALKVLRRRWDSEAGDAERFRREARLCAALAHPNIVPLLDAGTTPDGTAYATFAFVPGTTLRDVLASEGALGVAETGHLMAQLLDALSCAHRVGIVHRDLKPENVMIAHTGARRNALVLDFGLGGFAAGAAALESTRLTASGDLLGTPAYAAPEQLRGEEPSPHSDHYSWGLIFLECLTGQPVIRGASMQELIQRQLSADPVAIPRWLRNHPLGRILETATAKQSGKRVVSPDQLLPILAAIAAGADAAPRTGTDVPELERRQLSVVCFRLRLDLGADTAHDVEDLDRALREAVAALTERVGHVGGLMTPVVGDRVMAVFGYPQTHEDDAKRAAGLALECALMPTMGGSMAPVALQIGIHTGIVAIRDPRHWTVPRVPELSGLTPQIACLVADGAAGGEVLVSLDTLRLLRDEFEHEPAVVRQRDNEPLTVVRLRERRRPTRVLDPGGDETPLVGRDFELQRLLDGWRQACAGRSAAVAITGEAGIGKSRLLRELHQRAAIERLLTLECAEENQGSPLRPVIDALSGIDQPLEVLLTTYGLGLADNLPLLGSLLSLPPDARYELPPLTPERRKELTLRALLRLLCRMAEREPLLLVVENLHWADPTTLELAHLVVSEIQAGAGDMRLLSVFTTRPEGIPRWSAELGFVPLQRLPPADVQRMVATRLPAGVSEEIVDQVLQRSEGVPLFVEEITRLLVDSGGGALPASRQLGAVEVPGSLRDLLNTRLDGVSRAARETAQLAAVLGREFNADLLHAVSPKDDAVIRDELEELTRAGLLLARRARRDEGFVFRHALLRDAAYDTLTKARRQSLHRRVARVLREQFAPLERTRPDILAWHCEHAGDLDGAIAYWSRAGGDSYGRAAYAEALRTFKRGLGLLAQLDPTPPRQRLEMATLIGLGSTLLATRGWAVPEVEETFARAWDLSETIGGDPPLMVIYGVWGVRITRSDRAGVDAMLPRLRQLAEHAEDPAVGQLANGCHCAAAYWRGDFATAKRYLEIDLANHGIGDPPRPAERRGGWNLETGDNGRLNSLVYATSALWAMGQIGRSLAMREEALVLAEQRREPTSLALALGFGSMVAHDCGDTVLAREWGERLMALANEQQLYFWWAPGACAVGRAQVADGEVAAGLDLIRQGLDRYRLVGVMCSYNYYLTYLVEAYLRGDHLTDAQATIDESLQLCTTLLARFHEPELLRLRGQLGVRRGDPAAAEADFRAALAMAERDQCHSYALRAATDLARLLRGRGNRHGVEAVLRPVYSRFTGEPVTADIRAANELLS
jgi:TOMM system kinase/cyclase fusion protein